MRPPALWLMSLLISACHPFFVHHGPTHIAPVSPNSKNVSLGSFSFGEQPLLFTRNKERGKENQLVLSQSKLFGLNKILNDSKRRMQANTPVYDVGSIVYVKGGTLGCCRGTVLDNRRSNIGDPWQVLLALDCRDSRGLVPDALQSYHGCAMWLSEESLTSEVVYEPLTAPELSKPRSYTRLDSNARKRETTTLGAVYQSQLISARDLEKIGELYHTIKSANAQNHDTARVAFVQLARQSRNKSTAIKWEELVRELEADLASAISMDANAYDPLDIAWLYWSLSTLHQFITCNDTTNLIYKQLHSMLDRFDLENLTPPLLRYKLLDLLLHSVRFRGDADKSLCERLLNLIINKDHQEHTAKSLEYAMVASIRCKVASKKLFELVCDWIGKNHAKISSRIAIYFLDGLTRMTRILSVSTVKKNPSKAYKSVELNEDIKEILYSIIYADEGFERYGSKLSGSLWVRLLRSTSDSQNLDAIYDKLVAEGVRMPTRKIAEALRFLMRRPNTKMLVEHLVKVANEQFDDCNDIKSLSIILKAASRCKNLPRNFETNWLDAARLLEDEADISDYDRLFQLPKSIFFFTFYQNHKRYPELYQYGIELFERELKALESHPENATQRNMANMYLATDTLSSTGIKSSTLARTVANILRKCLALTSPNMMGLLLDVITRIDPDLFCKCGNYIRRISDGDGNIEFDSSEISKPLIELLLAVTMHMANMFTAAPCTNFESNSPLAMFEIPKIGNKDEDIWESATKLDYKVHWPIVFLLNLTHAGIINPKERSSTILVQDTYSFAKSIPEDLSNADLNILHDALAQLDMLDVCNVKLLTSKIEKGISRITNS